MSKVDHLKTSLSSFHGYREQIKYFFWGLFPLLPSSHFSFSHCIQTGRRRLCTGRAVLDEHDYSNLFVLRKLETASPTTSGVYKHRLALSATLLVKKLGWVPDNVYIHARQEQKGRVAVFNIHSLRAWIAKNIWLGSIANKASPGPLLVISYIAICFQFRCHWLSMLSGTAMQCSLDCPSRLRIRSCWEWKLPVSHFKLVCYRKILDSFSGCCCQLPFWVACAS